MDWIVVVAEDTGFSDTDTPIPPAPIELAALRVRDWQVVGRLYCRWRPTLTVQPKAAAVNGYTPEAWAWAWPMTQGDLDAFADIARGAQWAGSFPDYDFRLLDAARRAFGMPAFPLATHRKIDVGSLGAPMLRALGVTRGGMDPIVDTLAGLGMPVPPMPADLATMARGRTGPHTAMGDAWRTLHALRCLWRPAERHWRTIGAMFAADHLPRE